MVVRDCVHYHASGALNYGRLVDFPMRPRFRNVNERDPSPRLVRLGTLRPAATQNSSGSLVRTEPQSFSDQSRFVNKDVSLRLTCWYALGTQSLSEECLSGDSGTGDLTRTGRPPT